MDPKVCGKLLSTHGEGDDDYDDDDDDEGLRDGSPSWNRLQDGISTGTKATAMELGFSLCSWSFWGMWTYIGRRRAPRDAPGGHEAGGAPWEGGRASTLEGHSRLP